MNGITALGVGFGIGLIIFTMENIKKITDVAGYFTGK